MGDIIVLYADVPGVDEALMTAIIDRHRSLRRSDPAYGAIVVTGSRSNSSASASSSYGRILRDKRNPSCISQIVEKKQINLLSDSDPQKRMLDELDEFNSGIFIARAPALFSALSDVKPHQVGSERYEYYATDFVHQMVASGLHVYAWQVPPVIQYKIEGANTLEELEEIEIRRRAQRERAFEVIDDASQPHLIDGASNPTELGDGADSVPCNRRD